MNTPKTVYLWSLILLLTTTYLLSGCEENPPFVINLDDSTNTDTTDTSSNNNEVPLIYKDTVFTDVLPAAQEKTVLLEEFTGVRCVNCPAGHEISNQILEDHPNRVFAAIVHAGFLADPYSNSTQDFVTNESSALYDFLSVEAVPAAAVNRVLFAGASSLALINKSQWAGKVNSELQKVTPVNIYAYHQYNQNTRQLTVYVQLRYLQDVSAAQNVSVFLTENNIIDPQAYIDDSGHDAVQDDYVHKHVLRDALTPISGQPLGETGTASKVIVRSFSTTVSNNWKPSDCHIIAFVNNASGDKEVLQVTEIPLVE